MRSEKEMFDLILGIAENDERVRAVCLSGSRADPNAERDVYQDYDIIYIVTDIAPFYNKPEWIGGFGKILMLQMPEIMRCPIGDGHFTYLTLFDDGSRIDLSVYTLDMALNLITVEAKGEPIITLLDKDDCLPALPKPSDEVYWVKPPNELSYFSCCNDFWWCLQNVAKGIARDELPYAMEMYNHYVHGELNDMARWYIGVKTDFSVSAGKMGKRFKKYLPSDLYEKYVQTYSNGDYENLWAAVFTACELFSRLARVVGEHFNYSYNQSDEQNMTSFLLEKRKEAKENQR